MGRGRVVIAEEIGRPGIDEPVVGIGSWGGGSSLGQASLRSCVNASLSGSEGPV